MITELSIQLASHNYKIENTKRHNIDKVLENNKIKNIADKNYNLKQKEFLRFGFKDEDSYNDYLSMLNVEIQIESRKRSG